MLRSGSSSNRTAIIISSVLALLTVVLVVASLHRPDPPTFNPTPARAAEAGRHRVGPAVYTVDATSSEVWRFFDFSRGSVVERPDPRGWDLAFRRFHIIANGGAGFAGRAGIRDLGDVAFDSVRVVPAAGYQSTTARADSVNPAMADWYDYGFTSHLLMPKPRVYAVRTADGRYAKLELLSYYCTGARPGCITFRYVYQGNGSRRLAPGASPIVVLTSPVRPLHTSAQPADLASADPGHEGPPAGEMGSIKAVRRRSPWFLSRSLHPDRTVASAR